MMRDLRDAWRKAFPAWNDRRQLAAEWAQLGRCHKLLSEIAMRGRVYAPNRAPDLFLAGVLEGRRQLALEIIQDAGTDPAILQAYCLDPRKPQE